MHKKQTQHHCKYCQKPISFWLLERRREFCDSRCEFAHKQRQRMHAGKRM